MTDTGAKSRLAEIRKKFQGNGTAFVPTPESQFGRMKRSKEDQARAVRVAKARAARYNMTLRALAIKTTQNVTKMQKSDVEAKKEAQDTAAKYNMTSRALNVSRGLSVTDQHNIGKALGDKVAPSVAKDVLTAVAKKPQPKEEDEDVPTDDEDEAVVEAEEVKKVEKSSAHKARIEMSGVEDAIKSGDEEALNKSILTNFLEVHAPHLLGAEENLLGDYKSQLHVLFKTLLKKYPGQDDAEISGQQKADKEISEAVASGDVKPVEEEEEEDEDDSLVMQEDKIDEYVAPAPKKEEEDDDDDDSLVIEADKAFEKGYETAIRAAEDGKGVMKSLARRRTTLKETGDLASELKKYSFKSVESDDSLIMTDMPEGTGAAYITAAELEETAEEEAPSRWAVQFQNTNVGLKQKLLKQGLSKDQVDNLVNNLESNTSEML